MLVRDLRLCPYEFGEVLELSLIEKDSKGCLCSLCRIRIPVFESTSFLYSVECSPRGYGYVSKEVFHLKNFLELEDWRNCLDSYSDFVFGRL